MEAKEAIELVNALVMAVYHTAEAERQRYGGTTATWKKQQATAKDLLTALIGREPTEKELEKAAQFRIPPRRE